jgi:hypothetical protein
MIQRDQCRWRVWHAGRCVGRQRAEVTVLVCWTDSSGNLWLFGGYGFDPENTLAFLNDLAS